MIHSFLHKHKLYSVKDMPVPYDALQLQGNTYISSLQQSQAHWEAIVAHAPFHIYTLDLNFCLTSFNQSWQNDYHRFFGKTPSLGIRLLDLSPPPFDTEFRVLYERVLQGEEVKFEQKMPHENREEWFDVIFSPIIESTKIVGILCIAHDVTEKKRSQIILQQAHDKYRGLINNANDAIFLANPDTGKITDANLKAQELMKMSLEELVDLPHAFLHPPHVREQYQQILREFAKTGIRNAQLFLIQDKEGNQLPVDISSSVIEINNQKYIQGIFRDMTHRLVWQQALDEKEDFYQKILNNMPIDVAVLDSEDRYQFLNPRAVKDSELRKWLIGKEIIDYYKFRNLDTKRAEDKQTHLDIARNTRQPVKWEEKLIDRDGVNTTLLRRFTPIFGQDGELQMSIFTGENISYLKATQQKLEDSEHRYRNLIETTNDWIWETNDKGVFTYSSPQIEDILGYTAEEILGKSPKEFMPENTKKLLSKHFRQIWNSGLAFNVLENLYQHKDGKMVYLQTNGAPVYVQGILTNYRGIARNITAQKMAEQTLKETLAKLKDRNFELDSFVYRVSHDLRAPLSSMLGLMNLMEYETEPDKFKDFVEMLKGRATTLDNFITTVLAYSQNLNQEKTLKIIDFKAIVAKCFEELAYMPCAPRLKHLITLKQETDFYCDPFRLMIIFKNFISNAIKYQKKEREQSTLHINIDVGTKDVLIVFQDEGIGIAKEHLPKIFDMFFRATEKAEGSGLGLYIVRQTIEKLKGKVKMDSLLGIGTTITIVLPNVSTH